MKKFDKLFMILMLAFVGLIIVSNVAMNTRAFTDNSREYRVAVNRIEKALLEFENEEKRAPRDLGELCEVTGECNDSSVIGLECVPLTGDMQALFRDENADYQVVVTNQYIYKITYKNEIKNNMRYQWIVNIVLLFVMLVFIGVYLYIRTNILEPFHEFSELPYELAKGKLNRPLEESKNKYFGRFIWGMNLLREHLEETRARELNMQRDKKLLLLSLSHDIKTPLNAISLYAKSISRNLYKDEEKKKEVAEHINEKVYEIEGYISDIVKASNEDFLNFEVQNTEFYVGDALEFVKVYYADKMALNNIDFEVPTYANALIFGDKERLIEVIQNIVENAIKYGDGRRIQFSMTKDTEEYAIVVRNTGCSLPDNEISHVFDSFFRGTNVEAKNGSGLGLYICRQLMHLMEGEVLASIVNMDSERMMEVKVVLKMG